MCHLIGPRCIIHSVICTRRVSGITVIIMSEERQQMSVYNYSCRLNSKWFSNINNVSAVREEETYDIYVLLQSLGRYLCWWTICLRGYHPPSSQCFYHWVDTTASVLLIQKGIICPTVSVSSIDPMIETLTVGQIVPFCINSTLAVVST
jgi:hypothetical protein